MSLTYTGKFRGFPGLYSGFCPQNAKKSPIFYRHSAHFCSVASPAIRQKASPNPGQGLILMTIKPGQSEKFSILALAISTR